MHCADAQLIKSIYQVIIYFIQAKLTNQRNPLQKKGHCWTQLCEYTDTSIWFL